MWIEEYMEIMKCEPFEFTDGKYTVRYMRHGSKCRLFLGCMLMSNASETGKLAGMRILKMNLRYFVKPRVVWSWRKLKWAVEVPGKATLYFRKRREAARTIAELR